MPRNTKRKAGDQGGNPPVSPGYVFDVLDALPQDDDDMQEVVAMFLRGSDLSLDSEKTHSLSLCLAGLDEVAFDTPTLDALFHSLDALDPDGADRLQHHPMSATLATYLYGTLSGNRSTALRAGKLYFGMLRKFGANCSRILNSYFVRRVFSLAAQPFASVQRDAGGAAGSLTQETDGGTQQSIVMTPDVTASQAAHVSASQKPKRRRVRKGGAGDTAPDYADAYELVLQIISMFRSGSGAASTTSLLDQLDGELSPVVLEAVVGLPAKEMSGPAKAKVVHPSPLLQACFGVLREAMQRNGEYAIFESTAAPADGDGDGEEGAQEDVVCRKLTAQELILPQLLPYLHLSLHYMHTAVKLADAKVLQSAALELVEEGGVASPNLLLLFKTFLFTAERRPRSEPLAQASQAAVVLLERMDAASRTSAVEFLLEIMESDKVFHRLFALEVAYSMLCDEGALEELGVDGSQGVVAVIFRSVNDTAPVVRTKSLTNLSRILQDAGHEDCPARAAVAAYLTRLRNTPLDPNAAPPTNAAVFSGDAPRSASNSRMSSTGTCLSTGSLVRSHLSGSPGIPGATSSHRDYLVAAVVARTREVKALVRKAAVGVLLQFFHHKVADAGPVLSTVVELMDIKLEPSVLVRREAVLCAWKVVLMYPEVKVRSQMLAAILDNSSLETEDYVLKSVLQSVQHLVIGPLTGKDHELSSAEVWDITATFSDAQLSSLGKLCCKLLENGDVGECIVRSLLTRINESPGCRDAWSMLSIFAVKYKSKIEPAVVMKCFRTLKKGFHQSQPGDSRDHSVLGTVMSLIPDIHLSQEEREEVHADLERLILTLRCHVNLVNAVVTCFCKLAPKSKALRMVSVFNKLCASALYNELSQREGGTVPPEVRAAGYDTIRRVDLPVGLCTVGALLMSDVYISNAQEAVEGNDEVSGTVDLTQLAGLVAAACSMSISKDAPRTVPESVVLHCYILQIRLCLASKMWCTKGISLLLNGLTSGLMAVRTTCLNGLADLSLKYPGTVDRFLPNMSALLNDDDVRVRMTAATLLSQLLGESYLKLRPFLFFEMLSLVADHSASVAAFARYSILKVMCPKDQYLIANNFKETLFVLNNYKQHPKFNKLPTSITRLQGEAHRYSRVQLMRFLASQVRNEKDILRVHEQLHEVLEMCTDATVSTDQTKLNLSCAEGIAVFQDCVQVLLSEELNLQGRTLEAVKASDGAGKGEASTEAIEDEEAAMRMQRDLWAGAVKVRIRDQVCPILCAVSAKLRALRSPLQRDLVHYAAYVCQEYEKEMHAFILDDHLLRDVRATLEETRRVRGGRKLGMTIAATAAEAPTGPPSTPCPTPARATSYARSATPTPGKKRISVARPSTTPGSTRVSEVRASEARAPPPAL